jgi:hypothetical protein
MGVMPAIGSVENWRQHVAKHAQDVNLEVLEAGALKHRAARAHHAGANLVQRHRGQLRPWRGHEQTQGKGDQGESA